MSGSWLVEPVERGEARRRRLFCLPYAGGGASMYEPFRRHLAGTAVTSVRLPGRESRFGEPPLHDIGAVVDALAPVVAERVARDDGLPWAVFGYSLGALVAYELVARLAGSGGPVPRLLAVGGSPAPSEPRTQPPVSWLDDQELTAVLREMGGTDPEVLAVPELMALVLPVVRADFRILETYRADPGTPRLPCDLVTYCGEADPEVSPARMRHWSGLVDGTVEHRTLPGGHFAITERPADLLAVLAADLERLVV